MAMPQEVLEQLCDSIIEYKESKGWNHAQINVVLDENETIDKLKNRFREIYSDKDVQVVVDGGLIDEDIDEHWVRINFV